LALGGKSSACFWFGWPCGLFCGVGPVRTGRALDGRLAPTGLILRPGSIVSESDTQHQPSSSGNRPLACERVKLAPTWEVPRPVGVCQVPARPAISWAGPSPPRACCCGAIRLASGRAGHVYGSAPSQSACVRGRAFLRPDALVNPALLGDIPDWLYSEHPSARFRRPRTRSGWKIASSALLTNWWLRAGQMPVRPGMPNASRYVSPTMRP